MTVEEALTALASQFKDGAGDGAIRHLREKLCRELEVEFHDKLQVPLTPKKEKQKTWMSASD